MTCLPEERLNAYLDGELAVEDRGEVDAHLAACAACAAALRAVRDIDGSLANAFAPLRERREAVTAKALDAVHLEMNPPNVIGFLKPLLGAAAGFLVAAILFRPWERPQPKSEPPIVMLAGETIAKLEIATGEVEVKKGASWTALATGAEIPRGACVRTSSKSKASFIGNDGSEIRLNGNTELTFAEERRVALNGGQIFTSVQPADTTFEVATDDGLIKALGTKLDIAREAAQTILTVVSGKAEIADKRGGAQTLEKGYSATIQKGTLKLEPRSVNVYEATAWANEILIYKSKENPELEERVNAMLAMLGKTKMEYMGEEQIRALGDHCAVPLTRYIQSKESQKEQYQRRSAARILADIASPDSIPELINLLGDGDAEVRASIAKGLFRLTQRSMGMDPGEWKGASAAERERAVSAWQEWWKSENSGCWGPWKK